MRKKIIVILIGLCCGNIYAQNMDVGQGAFMRLGRGTQVAASGMNIGIEGSLRCDTGAVLAIGARTSKDLTVTLSAAQPLSLHTLRIDGNASLTAAELSIAGDLAMNTGIFNLNTAAVRLHGNIVNENEAGYITGGSISKTLTIKANTRNTTGLGISITSNRDYDSLCITRKHERQRLRSQQSIAKYYEFDNTVSINDIDFAYLNAFAEHPTDTYLLYYQGITQLWESIDAQTHASTKRVTASIAESIDIQKIALFPFPELNFTKLVSPNGDGINDYFEVEGIEKYEHSKLIIIVPDGKIIYEKTDYANDYDGEGTSDGTYYFMFFGDKDDRKPLKRGFFELRRQ